MDFTRSISEELEEYFDIEVSRAVISADDSATKRLEFRETGILRNGRAKGKRCISLQAWQNFPR